MRAFTRIRNLIADNVDLRHAIETLERSVGDHDIAIQIAFNTLNQLIDHLPATKHKVKIGFVPPEK